MTQGVRQKTARNMATFLGALGETANVTMACKRARLGRHTVYDWKKSDPEFAKAWAEAVDRGVEACEDEVNRRAFQGVDKPVFQGGRKVGTVREYSDTLAAFLLKAHRPGKYRERVEHSGPNGGPIAFERVERVIVDPKA